MRDMRNSPNIGRAFAGIAIAAALMAAAVSPVHAQQQDIEVTAEADKTQLAVGEELTLRVMITGSLNPRQPVMPEIDGLRALGPPGIERQTWIQNGQSGSTFAYRYRFRATEVGKVTIEPISVTVSGQTYRTEPLEVEIFQGIDLPTPVPGQERDSAETVSASDGTMFVTASVDNAAPYLGEQITYTFKFYHRSAIATALGRFGQPRYSPPGFSGFWKGGETDQNEYMETIGSNRYQVVELTTALFPAVVGTVVIEPASLRVPIDFLEAPNYLQADPIVVEVMALPPAAPPGFTGAVGSFDVTAEVDDTNGKVNEPVQLTVTVFGEGNFETLPDPAWPDFLDWRVFQSPSESVNLTIDGRIGGSRTYRSVLVPEMAGGLTIPEISYVYYDPNAQAYVETSTQPIPMSIAPTDGMSPLPPSTDGGSAVERAGSDVRHIKPVPTALGRSAAGLTSGLVYWVAWGVPLLAIAGAVAWRQTTSRRDIAAARRRSALPEALNALERAADFGADPRVVVADILLDYLSTRLDTPVSGLTHVALDTWLQGLGVPIDTVLQLEGLLGAAELAKYAPEVADSVDAEERFELAGLILNQIEEALDS